MAIEAVLVLLVLLSPGILADALYRFLLWRPEPEEHVRLLRSVLFSSASLLLVLALADLALGEAWRPLYLVPAWWDTQWNGSFASALQIARPWSLHSIVALLLSTASIIVMKREATARLVRWVTGQSLHRTAWDEFAAAHHKKWVFVKLNDGRHYYGELGIVSGDRSKDIVLWKPYPYSEEHQTYEVTGAAAAYFPEAQLASVIVPQPSEMLGTLQPYLGTYSTITGARIDERGEEGPAGGGGAKHVDGVGKKGESFQRPK